jgi:branched-chain amino acid transport system substrate-binding protein
MFCAVRALMGLTLLAAAVAGVTTLTAEPADSQLPTLTVYSSLPFQSASRPQARAIVRGARLALEERGGVAGGHRIRYVSLDDSSRLAGSWTPERASRNARRAARDRSTIAYIGEFNSGASAISIPILNEAAVPQISPTNTAIGLTRDGPGAHRGEPAKYYPLGTRSYVRLVPNDRVQARAIAVVMRDRGCRRGATFHDGEVYGKGVGRVLRGEARRIGLRLVHSGRINGRAAHFRRQARAARRKRADCVAFTGITANGAVQLFRDLARALPRARLFGSDGIAESGFADPREGGVPRSVGRRVLVTVATLAPSAYPEAGRQFFARYTARYRDRNPDPYAIYGYEAMQLVLDAVAAAGADRRAVIDRLFATRNRQSVLGTYGFDRFGDTTLRTYGLYGIRRGALVYAGAVDASG